MPVAAQCPSCGAPLSQASLLAVAPMCDHCGAVITTIGGTLGLTAPYALNDPVLTRERVEADLATLRNHRSNLAGMLEADKQKLSWGVEQHAILPNVPELLPLLPVPPFLTCLFRGLRCGAFGVLVSFGAIAGLGVLLLVVTIIVW